MASTTSCGPVRSNSSTALGSTVETYRSIILRSVAQHWCAAIPHICMQHQPAQHDIDIALMRALCCFCAFR